MAVTDEAIEGIRRLIAGGEFPPGSRLPKESELALRLGVSRNSLREAVRALELVGVVEARQGDGTYVTSLEPSLLLDVMSYVIDFSHDEAILQLLEVRRLLEPAATALAAARVTEEELEQIAAALDEMDRSTEPEPLLRADAAFHAAIARASGNAPLGALLGNLSGTTFRTRIRRAYSDTHAMDDTRTEHHRIYEALLARDPDLARAASAYHVAGVERWLRGVIERRSA
ncbi:MAG TPA: FCD domain-containing protein [Solirubrobacteraceae bacterium]|nr:FCD domain-containing protein [Solirubrobacteraceae bacterium]